MAQTVIGFFDDATEAQHAVEQLQSSGFTRDRIDLSRGSSGAEGMRTSGSSSNTSDPNTVRTTSDGRTVDTEGRNTNRFTDFFNSLFGGSDKDNDDADRYSHVAQRSNAIVTVHAQSKDEAERAADILDDCGAVDVDERSAQYGYVNTRNTEDQGDRRNMAGKQQTTIPRVQESLEVGKRTVEKGGARLRSRIVERPVEENIRLREEHVTIEHNPVNRPVSGADLNNLQDRDIELTERAEVPVVNKEARVVEEVKLSKEVSERNETVRDTVRNTEIDIENAGGSSDRNLGTSNDPDENDLSRRNTNL